MYSVPNKSLLTKTTTVLQLFLSRAHALSRRNLLLLLVPL